MLRHILKEAVEASTDEQKAEEIQWLSASGHLFTGVNLYIVTDTTVTLYGFVEDNKKGQTLLYVEASGKTQWFERRTPLFINLLKVRSDDPYLQ